MFVLDLLLWFWLGIFDPNTPSAPDPPTDDGLVYAMEGGTGAPPDPKP